MLDLLPAHRDYFILGAMALICVAAGGSSALLIRSARNQRRLSLPIGCVLGPLVLIFLTTLLATYKYIRIIPVADLWLQAAAERVRPDEVCAPMRAQALTLTEPGAEDATGISNEASCSLQTVLVPDPVKPSPTRATFDQCWPSTPEKTAFAPLCYQIAFLELKRDGSLIDQSQLVHLQNALTGTSAAPKREVYAIAFVHGWRHGAALSDSNVSSLRLMASYAASHLQERCRVAKEHCGAKVLAIYISWPASIVHEWTETPIPCWFAKIASITCNNDVPSWADISALLTFPSRKRLSDEIGSPILSLVWSIRKAMGANDHLVLIGHSLGGNALLTGSLPLLQKGIERSAAVYDNNGPLALESDKLQLPSDLLVLLNPASEAEKLVQIRSRMAESFAINPVYQQPSTRNPRLRTWLADANYGSRVISRAGRFWPASMPPRVMIFAARCGPNYLKHIPNSGTPGDYCDTVVDGAFHQSQTRFEGFKKELEVTGIGHLSYGSLYEEVSTTHDVDVNGQAGKDGKQGEIPLLSRVIRKTQYSSIFRADTRCMVDPGWLYRARAGSDTAHRPHPRDFRGPSFTTWDAGPGRGHDDTLNVWADVGAPGQSNIQFAYPEIARPKKPSRGTPAQASDPIWAVQANPSFITTHSAIVSAPVFCAVSKLVLDLPGKTDVVRPKDLHIRNQSDFSIRTACDHGKLPASGDVKRLFSSTVPNSAWRWCVAHPRPEEMPS